MTSSSAASSSPQMKSSAPFPLPFRERVDSAARPSGEREVQPTLSRPSLTRGPPSPEREREVTHKTRLRFPYRHSPDQDRPTPARHPVVVVGAGPVGLAAAIDLAQRGMPVVLLDDADRIGEGSRGI